MQVIGIDIGTTGSKAMRFDGEGRAVGTGYAGYGLVTSPGGHVEQDPREWYSACVQAVRGAMRNGSGDDVVAISLSTQGASSLLLDESLQPLTQALTWMDTRATSQSAELEKELGQDFVYHATGWRMNPSLDLAKARWLVENEPGLLQQARFFVSTLEYMNLRLAGQPVVDPTNAAIRQMMDIRTRQWDERLVAAGGLSLSMLPEIQPTGAFLGTLTPEAARDMGLPRTVKVYNGAHDQYAGALGADAIEPGDLMVSTGTAWVALAAADEAIDSPSFISPGPHVLPGRYGALASTQTAGAALNWLKTNVTELDYTVIEERCAQRIHACRTLFFYPYLAGPAFPLWNDALKAAFLGIELDHDRYDLALACMEGVAFQFRMLVDDFRANGIAIRQLKVFGGATNSALWMKILSSICGARIQVMTVRDTACVGAAAIAGVGCGAFDSYASAIARMNGSVELDLRDPETTAFYLDKYERYRRGLAAVQQFYA